MQAKANGDSQEKSAGEVKGHKVQQLKDGRHAARQRVFTRWINHLLQRFDPAVEVHDLFTDIQDGRVLMALLEQLSGCKLLYRFRSSSHRIFRLNNISKALAFLDDRHVRLLGIDACSIVDGVPSVILSLIWNIILHFQVKVVTGGLQRLLSASLSSSSVNSYSSTDDPTPIMNDNGYSCKSLPRKSSKAKEEPRYQGKAIKTLLQWVQRCTTKFGVEVHDFGKSWRSGMPFLALIKSVNPALVDLMESQTKEPRENVQLALDAAHRSLNVPPLLEPEDVVCKSPDEKSIITYVSLFLRHCADVEEDQITNSELPGIPNFGSLESVSFGEIPADEPEAKALLRRLQRSTEQQLWKRWTRKASAGPRKNSLHKGGASSELSSSCGDVFSSCHSQDRTDPPQGSSNSFTSKRNNTLFKSPSPLDAGITSQDIRLWMERAAAGQSRTKDGVDERRFSLSSEEGIYSLSVLDSDEEEAYSYILELNEEDSLFYNQVKRQVPRVEEETEEEMMLNGQQSEELKHLSDNECKHLDESLTTNGESGVSVQSGRKFNRQLGEDAGDDADYCEEATLETPIYDETLKDITKIHEVQEAAERGTFEKGLKVLEEKLVDKAEEERHLPTFKEMKDRMTERDEEDVKKDERRNQPSVINVTSYKGEENTKPSNEKPAHEVRGADSIWITTEGKADREDEISRIKDLVSKDEDEDGHRDEDIFWMVSEEFLIDEEKKCGLRVQSRTRTKENSTIIKHPASKTDRNGNAKLHKDDNPWTPAGRKSSQSFRGGGGSLLQALAAYCGVTQLELEMLLVLWILIYCCLISTQLNL